MEVDAAVVSKLEETLAQLEDGLSVTKARLATAERNNLILKMDPDDRKAYETLSKEDKARVIKRIQDGKGVSKILDPVKVQIAKSQELPESVQKRFQDQEEKIAKQDEEIKKANERVAKAEAAAELVELSKRAEKEYPNLPGTDIEKGMILRVINGLEKPLQETVTKMLTAGNEALKKTFIEKGSSGIEPGGADEKLDQLAKALVTENVSKGDGKLTFAKAYDKVLQMHPDLYTQSLREQKQRVANWGN